jgi:NAD(P)-dependent dehydrogenase (short-subunit alcohol dehydrogenase family)
VNGRRILVTGGFGALGRVVAQAFVARGDKVARVDFAAQPSEPLAGAVDFGGYDLSDAAAAARAVQAATAALGGLDVLVNIAGGFTWQTLADGDIEAWSRMFAMNVLSAATMSKLALPHLLQAEAGRIVNIGAASALRADTGMGAYGAAKSGVHRLTESLAAELAESNVTVNAVMPSIIDTPANRADMPGADYGKWVRPQSLAEVILFLASPAAGAVTGALIPVTRGG